MDHPTLLRTPSPELGFEREIPLLLRPEDYEIRQVGDLVHVIARATGETVWTGPGPAAVVTSDAPF